MEKALTEKMVGNKAEEKAAAGDTVMFSKFEL